MEFLHDLWPGNLADPFTVDVESAPRTQPAVATDLDASHRVFPPLELNPCHPRSSPRLDHPSVPRNGRVRREQEAWEGKTFFFSLTARCVVSKGPRSIHRNDAPNTMGRCVCSMPPASLTVAPVLYASNAKDMAHHPKTSSCQCCPASTASASARRAAAFVPCCPCPSSHPLG